MNDHYKTLCERRDWLEQRIIAKKKVGWETHYDEREHAALVWLLDGIQTVAALYGGRQRL